MPPTSTASRARDSTTGAAAQNPTSFGEQVLYQSQRVAYGHYQIVSDPKSQFGIMVLADVPDQNGQLTGYTPWPHFDLWMLGDFIKALPENCLQQLGSQTGLATNDSAVSAPSTVGRGATARSGTIAGRVSGGVRGARRRG
jgi:hypothetical protein